MSGTLLSFGHGYTARELAPHLLADGWKIVGTTRSETAATRAGSTDVEILPWPGSDLGRAIAETTHILVSVPPDRVGDPVLNREGARISRHAERLVWVGYLSTTGVYGDHAGDWVDEDTPVSPTTERAKRRVNAENAWRDTGFPVHIFRIAGIYGPDRGPFAKVLKGTALRIIKPGQVFSRIHVSDIASVLKASMLRPAPGAIYNVCDDEPAPPEDVIAYAARLLDVPVPEAIPFDRASLTPMARSFYSESKRVRNERIKTELGIQLRYPDYRSGLAALREDARRQARS